MIKIPMLIEGQFYRYIEVDELREFLKWVVCPKLPAQYYKVDSQEIATILHHAIFELIKIRKILPGNFLQESIWVYWCRDKEVKLDKEEKIYWSD